MPVSVSLKFTPPEDKDMVAMKVYESDVIDGAYTLIDTVNDIGTYPTYIDHFTTALAVSKSDWFSIEFIDNKGAVTARSNPVQGGTETLVGDITDRIMLRDPQVNENIARELAEATIEQYFSKDPYTVDVDDVKYRIKIGLTFLALASIYTVASNSSMGTTGSWVAGLLSMNNTTSVTASAQNIAALEKEASKWLGKSIAVVAHLAEIEIVRGLAEIASADHSRLLVEVE
jgi:hypothetical protein